MSRRMDWARPLARLCIVALCTCAVWAAVAASAYASAFSLTSDAQRLKTTSTGTELNKWALACTTTKMQSFAFNQGESMYVAQVTGADSSGTYASHLSKGDLTITKIHLTDGAITSTMKLTGFGHGVSLGVETRSDGDYVWIECNSSAGTYGGQTEGRGTKIGCFKWAANTTLDTGSSAVTKYALPLTGATQVAPALDAGNGLIAVRYMTSGGRKLSLYGLSSFKVLGMTATPISTCSIPDSYNGCDFQGFTTYGPYFYLSFGTVATSDLGMNNKFQSYSWGNSTPIQTAGTSIFPVSAGYYNREPEGLAVLGGTKLVFGLASTATSAGGTRYANWGYKTF